MPGSELGTLIYLHSFSPHTFLRGASSLCSYRSTHPSIQQMLLTMRGTLFQLPRVQAEQERRVPAGREISFQSGEICSARNQDESSMPGNMATVTEKK